MSSTIRKVIAVAALATAFAVPVLDGGHADACAFHLHQPGRTAVDWLIESKHLVLARNRPDNEYIYEVVETLRGGDRAVEIGLLVDSVTRRRLAGNPGDAVLFASSATDDAWRRVAYLDSAHRELVDTILASMGTWGPGYDPARFEMFEALQDHPDRNIRNLALLEMDKAPYALLRTIDLRIAVDDLLAALWVPSLYPYQSIRVLLLGLSDSNDARAVIRRGVDRAATGSWSSGLGALATALIELDGIKGVTRLETTFLADPGQPLDKLETVVSALALQHGIASSVVRDGISDALQRFVDRRPEGAALVARQFFDRGDFSQAEPLATVMRQRRLSSSADLMAVALYVAQAREAARDGGR